MTLHMMFQSRNCCLETYKVKPIQKQILKSVILDLRAQCKKPRSLTLNYCFLYTVGLVILENMSFRKQILALRSKAEGLNEEKYTLKS